MHQQQHYYFPYFPFQISNPRTGHRDSTLLGLGVGSKIKCEAFVSFLNHATEAHGKQGVRESLLPSPTIRHKNILLQESNKKLTFLPRSTLEQNLLRGLRNNRVPEERVQHDTEPKGAMRGELRVIQHGSRADVGGGAEQRNEALQRGVQQVLRQEDERDSGDVGLEPGLARGTLAGLLWGLKERVEGALVGQLAAPESADI